MIRVAPKDLSQLFLLANAPTDFTRSKIPALIFGAILLVVGVGMLLSQRTRWQKLASMLPPPADVKFLSRRFQRRMQISGMIVLIGIMIPLGDSLIPWQRAPATFAVYWMIVLVLAMWTGLLAVGDIVSTRAHMYDELNRLHRSELQLRNEARRYQNTNGSGPSKN